MKTKKFNYLILFLAVAAFNVVAFTSGANEMEKTQLYQPRSADKECYETMTYCGVWPVMEYACKLGDGAGSRCSHYVCQFCTPN